MMFYFQAKEFKNDKEKFEFNARKLTEIHASAPKANAD